MPTYDYVCDACDHKFEQFQSMNDATLKKCPKCSKNKLRRLIGTGAGIIFKGSGFYITDYKKGSSSPSTPESPAPKSDGGADKSCGSCGKTGPDVCD